MRRWDGETFSEDSAFLQALYLRKVAWCNKSSLRLFGNRSLLSWRTLASCYVLALSLSFLLSAFPSLPPLLRAVAQLSHSSCQFYWVYNNMTENAEKLTNWAWSWEPWEILVWAVVVAIPTAMGLAPENQWTNHLQTPHQVCSISKEVKINMEICKTYFLKQYT